MPYDYTYLTPRDTQGILMTEAEKCKNMGLILARYMPREVIDNDDVPNQRYAKFKDTWLKAICKDFEPDAGLVDAQLDRWIAVTENAPIRFQAKLSGRLVIGLGGSSPIETDIYLQHVTGLPIIPGSALKGLARNYGLLTIAAELGVTVEDKPLEELDKRLIDGSEPAKGLGERYRTVFGTQEGIGACIFHDAVLSRLISPLFQMDVMTPHFRTYYEKSGGKAPADNDAPNPIPFMTVTHGVTFAFAVGIRTGFDVSLAETTAGWLVKGLEELGIGAKTASGYGIFRVVD